MNYAVRFSNVRKEYPLYHHVTAGVKSFLFNLPKSISTFRKTRFEALKGVSFEVPKGETFGIIGRNGSGKSTILSLIANVIRQDGGSIEINGRVSSLLELGAGFHPDLSGIENIIMNGILMGNRRNEILKKADDIIAFSELADFIYQPLRTYSSGMQMRLGFSVAVHIEPEILLIDEALAVGDANFQEKCMMKMLQFKESGTTIVFVSHDKEAIAKLCDRAAWIDSGEIKKVGSPQSVIDAYYKHIGSPFEEGVVTGVNEMCPQETVSISEEGEHTGVFSIGVGIADDGIIGEPKESPVDEHVWWDYPLVIRHCEQIITESADRHLYEYLQAEHSFSSLSKGLSICRRLKGIEKNFIEYGICSNFDVIDQEEEIADMLGGVWNLKNNHYDLFVSVDFLSHMVKLDEFLQDMRSAIKDHGLIIAFEYTGPSHYRWSEKELQIARAINASLDISNDGEAFEERMSNQSSISLDIDPTHAVNSGHLIADLRRAFDVVAIKYYCGPLLDLVVNRVLHGKNVGLERTDVLIKMVLTFEQILVENGLLQNYYAMIIAKKDKSQR